MEQDFQQVVERYTPSLYRLAYSYCGSGPDAEDVLQDVFLKYLQHAPAFETEQARKSWLMKVTANRCRDLLKSAWRRKTLPLESAQQIAAAQPEGRELLAAVMALPPDHRIAVYLHYYEGCTVAEIARVVGAGQSAVRMRLHRARQTLRQQLGGFDDEP